MTEVSVTIAVSALSKVTRCLPDGDNPIKLKKSKAVDISQLVQNYTDASPNALKKKCDNPETASFGCFPKFTWFGFSRKTGKGNRRARRDKHTKKRRRRRT